MEYTLDFQSKHGLWWRRTSTYTLWAFKCLPVCRNKTGRKFSDTASIHYWYSWGRIWMVSRQNHTAWIISLHYHRHMLRCAPSDSYPRKPSHCHSKAAQAAMREQISHFSPFLATSKQTSIQIKKQRRNRANVGLVYRQRLSRLKWAATGIRREPISLQYHGARL